MNKLKRMTNGNVKLPLGILISMITLVQCASQPPVFDETAWIDLVNATDRAMLYAPHLNDDGAFFNPWMQRSPLRGKSSWFWSRMFGKKMHFDSFPQEQFSAVPNDYVYLSDNGFDSISYAGHSSLFIKMNNETIITDPFFSNSALVVRKKVRIKFDYSKFPQKPVVLISHNHYDHLDKSSVKNLVKKDAVFIVPLKLKDYLIKLGAREVHELDWWESVSLGGITYTLLPAQHWSNRLGQKARTTLWGSYMIEGSKTVYFSADPGYFRGFEEFGERYEIDYAILGVGAYEPRWFMHYSHMNVAEFFRAADDLKANISIPMHFGVISLSEEPLLYPLYEIDRFITMFPEYSKRITPLRVGEFLQIAE